MFAGLKTLITFAPAFIAKFIWDLRDLKRLENVFDWDTKGGIAGRK